MKLFESNWQLDAYHLNHLCIRGVQPAVWFASNSDKFGVWPTMYLIVPGIECQPKRIVVLNPSFHNQKVTGTLLWPQPAISANFPCLLKAFCTRKINQDQLDPYLSSVSTDDQAEPSCRYWSHAQVKHSTYPWGFSGEFPSKKKSTFCPNVFVSSFMTIDTAKI